MEKRSVKRYRSNSNYSRPIKRVEEKGQGHFFIRANIALGMVIVIMVGNYIDTPFTKKAVTALKERLVYNTSIEEVKNTVGIASNVLKNRDGVDTFAQDIPTDVKLDSDIIEKINLNKDIYYKNQKK